MLNLQDLTLEEKLGQMMMVGLNGNQINERIKTLILKYKVGGIVLYRKNFTTYEDMLNLIKDLKNLNSQNKIPLFIAIDQEGGRVNRMPKEFKNIPPAYKLAKAGNLEIVKEAGNITGEMLYKSGVNMNFAPVLDIKRFQDAHAIGDRSFGETKEDVCKFGIATMKELQSKKIVPVVKHFPGHGLTQKDSHFFLPVVDKNIEEIENEDMQPFKEAIKNGADAIMVGHIVIRGISRTLPASLSRKFIGEYLRRKYRFNGIVMTDDLKMKAIRFVYGYKLAIRQAFTSGSDIVMFRFGHKDETNAIEQAHSMVRNGQLKEHRINRSVRRILKVKEKYELNDNCELEGVSVSEINKRIDAIKQSLVV